MAPRQNFDTTVLCWSCIICSFLYYFLVAARIIWSEFAIDMHFLLIFLQPKQRADVELHLFSWFYVKLHIKGGAKITNTSHWTKCGTSSHRALSIYSLPVPCCWVQSASQSSECTIRSMIITERVELKRFERSKCGFELISLERDVLDRNKSNVKLNEIITLYFNNFWMQKFRRNLNVGFRVVKCDNIRTAKSINFSFSFKLPSM